MLWGNCILCSPVRVGTLVVSAKETMPDEPKHCISPVTVMPVKTQNLARLENSSLCINRLWGWADDTKRMSICLKCCAINPETLTGLGARAYIGWQAIISNNLAPLTPFKADDLMSCRDVIEGWGYLPEKHKLKTSRMENAVAHTWAKPKPSDIMGTVG